MRHHALRNFLRDKEAASQIGIEDQIPVIPRDLERRLTDIASSIVDENVDAPESRFSSDAHRLDAAFVAHIQFQRNGPAA